MNGSDTIDLKDAFNRSICIRPTDLAAVIVSQNENHIRLIERDGWHKGVLLFRSDGFDNEADALVGQLIGKEVPLESCPSSLSNKIYFNLQAIDMIGAGTDPLNGRRFYRINNVDVPLSESGWGELGRALQVSNGWIRFAIGAREPFATKSGQSYIRQSTIRRCIGDPFSGRLALQMASGMKILLQSETPAEATAAMTPRSHGDLNFPVIPIAHTHGKIVPHPRHPNPHTA